MTEGILSEERVLIWLHVVTQGKTFVKAGPRRKRGKRLLLLACATSPARVLLVPAHDAVALKQRVQSSPHVGARGREP